MCTALTTVSGTVKYSINSIYSLNRHSLSPHQKPGTVPGSGDWQRPRQTQFLPSQGLSGGKMALNTVLYKLAVDHTCAMSRYWGAMRVYHKG